MKNNIKYTTQMGLLLSLALSLSFLEMMVAPALALPLGVKLGLSNMITMFCLIHFDLKSAVIISLLKSVFVLLIRGVTSFCMSLSGGMASVFIMFLFFLLTKKKEEATAASVLGGVFHNLGQLAMAALLIGSEFVLYYLPILLVSGVIVGLITGGLITLILPKLNKINQKK